MLKEKIVLRKFCSNDFIDYDVVKFNIDYEILKEQQAKKKGFKKEELEILNFTSTVEKDGKKILKIGQEINYENKEYLLINHLSLHRKLFELIESGQINNYYLENKKYDGVFIDTFYSKEKIERGDYEEFNIIFNTVTILDGLIYTNYDNLWLEIMKNDRLKEKVFEYLLLNYEKTTYNHRKIKIYRDKYINLLDIYQESKKPFELKYEIGLKINLENKNILIIELDKILLFDDKFNQKLGNYDILIIDQISNMNDSNEQLTIDFIKNNIKEDGMILDSNLGMYIWEKIIEDEKTFKNILNKLIVKEKTHIIEY